MSRSRSPAPGPRPRASRPASSIGRGAPRRRAALAGLVLLLVAGCALEDDSLSGRTLLHEAAGTDAPAPGGEAAEPVDFRLLRELLPAELAGLARSGTSGERGGVAGLPVSQASAEYGGGAGEGERSGRITITDLGPLRGATPTEHDWIRVEVDRESEAGYERTTRFLDHPAHETLSHSEAGPLAQIRVVVAERFVVEVKGAGVGMEQLREGLSALDLARLASLADPST